MKRAFVVEIHDVQPGLEKKLDVPEGTKVVCYAWQAEQKN